MKGAAIISLEAFFARNERFAQFVEWPMTGSLESLLDTPWALWACSYYP